MQLQSETLRTTTGHPDFQALIKLLDTELWDKLAEDQATYDQYNKVPDIDTAVLVYHNGEAVACGCFKPYDDTTVEVKRMYVRKSHRGQGLSKKVLQELESWAAQKGYQWAVLETSVHFTVACNLYQSNGYEVIPNYGPYAGLPESICMKKTIVV